MDHPLPNIIGRRELELISRELGREGADGWVCGPAGGVYSEERRPEPAGQARRRQRRMRRMAVAVSK